MAKLKIAALGLAAAILVFAIYAPAIQNDFTGYDDREYVVDNVHVRNGVTLENTIWAFTAWHSNNWHPLTWISHAADSSLFGLSPAGHHATNLIYHSLNVMLLFLWLWYVSGGRTGFSLFVALGFGLHPLHVESVAWVAERKDVLSTFFWILTLIAYTAWVKRRGAGLYALTAVLLVAGLLAKQMLVTLPVLMLVLDFWPLKRRGSVAEKLPFFVIVGLAAAVVIQVQRLSGAASALNQLPLGSRLANAAVSYVRYLGKTLWPAELSVFYPFPQDGIAVWKVVGSIAILVGISVAVFRLRKTRPWLTAGWAWYVITLLPVIGIIQVGMQSMADRYMYMPMTGLLIAVAWEVSEWKIGGRQAVAVAAAVLAAWGFATWKQIPVWRDGVTLFSHALAVNPSNFVAHNNLGVELDRRGNFDEALEHYRQAISLRPGDRNGVKNYASANFAKGERLLAASRPDEALTSFREGLRYRGDAAARTQVGHILNQKKRIPEAMAEFHQALAIDPKLVSAHMGLAVAYAWTGHAQEARKSFANALQYDPNNVDAHFNLGIVLAVLGQKGEAVQHLEAALRLNSAFGPAQAALAEIRGK